MKQKISTVRLLMTTVVSIAPLLTLTSVTRADDVQNFYTPTPSPSPTPGPSSSPRPDPRYDYTPGTDRNSHMSLVSVHWQSLDDAVNQFDQKWQEPIDRFNQKWQEPIDRFNRKMGWM